MFTGENASTHVLVTRMQRDGVGSVFFLLHHWLNMGWGTGQQLFNKLLICQKGIHYYPAVGVHYQYIGDVYRQRCSSASTLNKLRPVSANCGSQEIVLADTHTKCILCVTCCHLLCTLYGFTDMEHTMASTLSATGKHTLHICSVPCCSAPALYMRATQMMQMQVASWWVQHTTG